MADFDDAPIALRTPLYPIISVFGLLMVVATFLTWASASNPDDSSISDSVTGLDAGGWGLSALIVGLVIAALGVLGYFWNPFSDPEAMFIAAFAAAALVASIVKIANPNSLFSGEGFIVDYFDSSPGVGLWIVLLASLAALVSGLWIAFSRPKAQARLT